MPSPILKRRLAVDWEEGILRAATPHVQHGRYFPRPCHCNRNEFTVVAVVTATIVFAGARCGYEQKRRKNGD
jgi:hypothetical protein